MDSSSHIPTHSFLGGVGSKIGSGIVSAGKTFLTRTKQVFGKSLPKNLSPEQKKEVNAARFKLGFGGALVIGGAVAVVVTLAVGIPLASSTFGGGAALLAVGIVGGLFAIGAGVILIGWGHSQMKKAEASAAQNRGLAPEPAREEVRHPPLPQLRVMAFTFLRVQIRPMLALL